MKNVITLLSIVFAFVACSDLNNLTKFDVDYQAQATMPILTAADSAIEITSDTVDANSSDFEANSTALDKIDEIALTKLNFQISLPEGANFNFIKNASVFIQGEGLDEEEVASIEEVPLDLVGTLDIPVTGIDLAKHVKAGKFVMRLKGMSREVTTEEYKIDILTTFTVDAKIIN